MEPVLGIDLGTFNSCVAIVENGTPTVIANRGGYKTTPSMVAITESGKRLVGHIAKRQAITNAENTVYAAKRLIGRKWNHPQIQDVAAMASYRIVEGPHNDTRISLRGKIYSVPEVSAMVLQEMKVIAEDYLGQEAKKAVITVPAYFNDGQRQATKDAGVIAGLDVIRIINEPTAAALAYGFGKNYNKTVAIFDLGGGTFDISILEIGGEGVFRVIGTGGDTFLGGEDFDQRITSWLIERFTAEHNIDLRQDRMALQRLKDASERAKCELSTAGETEINLPFIMSGDGNQALHLQRTLSRAQLEQLCGDLAARTIEICQKTLKEAELEPDDIEDVILVGGMTRMPLVQHLVTEFFHREPSKGVHPDEVVAVGAAIQGTSLVDDKAKTVLLDVTPHTLGIMVSGGLLEAIIPQNTSVPTQSSKVFTTIRDNQTAVKILVMQGASERAEQNDLLGEFTLEGLRRARAGEVEIEVTFSINADGIVNVSAMDLENRKAQSLTVTSRSALTPSEIKDMVRNANQYVVDRRQSDEEQKTVQEAERLIAEIEKLFPKVEHEVQNSDFGRDAVVKARQVVDRARERIAARDLPAIKEQIDVLSRTHRMFCGVIGNS